jgi:hypothetical protein
VALSAQAQLGALPLSAEPAERLRALLRAWRPFAAAHRVPWSLCVSLPEDVAVGDAAAAAAFRAQLSRLAGASLRRLRAALAQPLALFPALFEQAVFEQIVGLFELNNLDVCVESPVENYFLAVDDLPEGEQRQAALRVTQPLLDALDCRYCTPLDGTGFFPFVACANHSCAPRAASLKGERDVDGAAVLVATRRLREGEEVSVCYIDDALPLAMRRAQLVDYGFHCRCERCEAEERREGGGAERRGGKKK